MSIRAMNERARRDPAGFWGEAARAVTWDVVPRTILDASSAPLYRWFPDGMLNTSANALDRHVAAGRGERLAIIHDSPLTGTERAITYADLLAQVERLAGVLAAEGVVAGDRVIISMPMVPEAVVAMLACARLGAVHSVVFGGFAAPELAARIDDAKPVVIISASCGIEPARIVEYKPLLDHALHLCGHVPRRSIILQRPEHEAELGPRDLDWHEAVARAEPHGPVSVPATHPLYVLYTSGTTGRPKGIVRDHGGHAVAMAWTFPHIFGMGPDDTWWAASDVGWVVGHSYIAYAPLIAGATTVMYEGKPVGTPDAGAFWRVVEQHRVSGLFTAPTAIRAIRKEDPDGRHIAARDLSTLRSLFLAGERLDPQTYSWASEHLGIPVIDNWWQTETGWPIAANPRGTGDDLPIKPGSPSVPMPGYDVRIVDDAGAPVDEGEEGAIVIGLPLPPGTLTSLWGDDQRYIEGYLTAVPGTYATGDGGSIDADGYLRVMGRTDDVINVAGHRLSTGAMEAVVGADPHVAECAVIGVHDSVKGQVPRAFVVLKAGADPDPLELQRAVVAAVREEIGPVASLHDVVIVPALPKTRSGKILRRSMRAIADGRPEPVPGTIDDPRVLEAIAPLLRG